VRWERAKVFLCKENIRKEKGERRGEKKSHEKAVLWGGNFVRVRVKTCKGRIVLPLKMGQLKEGFDKAKTEKMSGSRTCCPFSGIISRGTDKRDHKESFLFS